MTRLSIIVPAYNEASRLRESVRRLKAEMDRESIPHELILVDDGSEDGTAAVIERCAAEESGVTGAGFPGNRGKGAAVAEGFDRSTGEVVLYTDADLGLGLDGILRCAREALGGAEIVVGSKAHPRSRPEVPPTPARRAASRAFRALVRALLRLPVGDTQCGLKAFSRRSAEIVFGLRTVDGFAFDAELLVIARRNGIPITEIPVTWRYHSASSVHGLGAGLRAVRDLARIWWNDLRGRYARRESGSRA